MKAVKYTTLCLCGALLLAAAALSLWASGGEDWLDAAMDVEKNMAGK